MTKLSVNVNKIATLRNTRLHLQIPDLIRLSKIAIEAGAAGITIHPRPDERHIKASDVDAIANLLKNLNASISAPDPNALARFSQSSREAVTSIPAPLSPSSGRGAGGEGLNSSNESAPHPPTPSPQKTGERGSNDIDHIAPHTDRLSNSHSDSTIEFNIEGNPFEGGYMEHCLRVRPTQCTLVPDTLAQSTSDHGWNLSEDLDRLRPVVSKLKSAGCRVSLFMDPIPEAMQQVAEVGADRVELYTEPYAASFARGDTRAAANYREAAIVAHALGLGINAGHDLSLENLGNFLQQVPYVLEVSIGHALIADALEFGLYDTVRRYLAICKSV